MKSHVNICIFDAQELKMKKFLTLFTLFAGLAIAFQSCKEDIDLVGTYNETAVVYGLLDQSDSVHFIKITRTFIGDGVTSNIDVAGIADSSYFDSVEGTVTEFYMDANGNPTVPTGRSFALRDTVVYNKDINGIFYAPEQKLYYFDNTKVDPVTNPTGNPLNEDYYYKLDLVINNGEFEVSGGTGLVRGMSNSNIAGSTQPYRFVNASNEFISTSVNVQNATDGTASVINTTLLIEFTEWVGTTGTTKTFKWQLGEIEGIEAGDLVAFGAPGATFYNQIAEHVTKDNPNIDKRTFNSITTVITGGAQELLNYMQVNEPTSSIAQAKPTYTNLTATNGHGVVGIFSARNVISIYKPFIDPLSQQVRCINQKSTEYLCIGTITNPYLFCSDHIGDVTKTWYCP